MSAERTTLVLVGGDRYEVFAPGYAGLMDSLRSAHETCDPVITFATETSGFKPASVVINAFIDKIVAVEYEGGEQT